ncbi:MAG: hypothetical protein ACK4P3_07370, partial [Fimbriimonadaceae bacterium]
MGRFTLAAFFALSVTLLFTAGCGGGSGGGGPLPPPPPGAVDVPFVVNWQPFDPNARTIEGPSNSLSFEASLTQQGSQNPWASVAGSRTPAQSGPTNFSMRVEPGPYRFDIRFYKEQNLSGRLVATASVNVVIAPDGSGIPNVVPTLIPAPPIASVSVLAGQSVPVGAQQPLQLQILDVEGNLIVPPLGSVQWISDNTSVLSFSQGLAVGNSPGTAAVTATFEGVSSTATPVSVTGSPTGGVGFAIAWGDRSGPRAAPSAALGFTLRLRQIQSDEVVLSFNGSRNQQILTELVQNYDTGIAVPAGNYRLEIDFFYNANQTGEVMGRVRTQVAIDVTGAGIGTITSFIDNPIASVRIVGGESGFSIPQGQILPIGFQARNAQGQLVPLSQTDGVFRIVSGAQFIR